MIKHGEYSLNNDTKTGKPRMIYISERGKKEIKKAFEADLRNRSKDSFVFRKRDN